MADLSGLDAGVEPDEEADEVVINCVGDAIEVRVFFWRGVGAGVLAAAAGALA